MRYYVYIAFALAASVVAIMAAVADYQRPVVDPYACYGALRFEAVRSNAKPC